MSSTTTTPPTASSVTPTSSPTQPSNNGGGPSSSLYLFTFLATLFLLLFVSSAIILRSFILRQRFRRRIEQALLSGVIPPNRPGGRSSRRRTIGQKPKLWEAWVSPAYGDRWDTIVPVSALPTSREQLTEVEGGGGTPSPPVAVRVPSPVPPPRPRLRAPRRMFVEGIFRNPFSDHSGSLTPTHPRPPRRPVSEHMSFDNLGQQNAPSSTQDRLQVTVLIAMPDARRPHMDGTAFTLPGHSKGKERSLDLDCDEDDLPEMVLGMTEPQYQDNIVTPKSP